MNNVLAHLRRKPGTKPPLLFVIIWSLAAVGIWILINSLAGRLVWWW
ncbi:MULTISPECIES: hypothetical protein [Methylobacterium]